MPRVTGERYLSLSLLQVQTSDLAESTPYCLTTSTDAFRRREFFSADQEPQPDTYTGILV